MNHSPIYLSIPSVTKAEKPVNNEHIINEVFKNYKGSKSDWKKIKRGISFVFKYCNTNIRYLGLAEGKKPIDYAVEVSNEVCKKNNIDTSEIDLLIYGGIYREYYEPATAMEIASKLGLRKVSAFDVTDACAGLMQSVQVAAALMQSNNRINYALCCTTDFPEDAINYDIQTFADLAEKSAGLTLGSGASAWLLSRKPLHPGGVKLLEMQNTSIPESYNVCKVPVKEKKFQSLSKEIFDLGIEHVPKEIKKITKYLNWKIDEVDYFIAHQPGKKIIQNICDLVGVPREKAPIIHHLYGNTINSSIPMTMDYIKENIGFKDGDKLIFNSAAAGFSMVTAAGVWEEYNG